MITGIIKNFVFSRCLNKNMYPNINIENNVVSMEGPINEIAKTAAGFFYASFILPQELKITMISKLSNLLMISNQRAEKKKWGRFEMPISRLVIKN